MKAAKSNPTTAKDAMSKATMPVIPSSAPDVEAEAQPVVDSSTEADTQSIPFNDTPDDPVESALVQMILTKLTSIILSYGENEQKALHLFHNALERVEQALSQAMIALAQNGNREEYQKMLFRFKDLVNCADPVDYEYEQNRLILYPASQIATMLWHECIGYTENTKVYQENRRNLNKRLTLIINLITQARQYQSVEDMYDLLKPLYDILSAFTLAPHEYGQKVAA